jgi:hypothetical protein
MTCEKIVKDQEVGLVVGQGGGGRKKSYDQNLMGIWCVLDLNIIKALQ